jgi:hypothetical protein
MSETRDGSIASTPESVQATAQTSEASAPAPNEITGSGFHGREGTAFLIGDGVARAVEGRPYERYSGQPKSERPLYRPLKILRSTLPSPVWKERRRSSRPLRTARPRPQGKHFQCRRRLARRERHGSPAEPGRAGI